MTGERRYGGSSRGRSPSPRLPPPRSRDVNPPRHWKLSPNRRYGAEGYSGEAKTSRRVDKMDQFDDGVPRFYAFDDRKRDRYGGRRFHSPRRNEDRDNFVRPVRFSDYEDGAIGKYDNEISVGRPGRSYDEGSYRGDLSSMKLKWEHPLGGSQKSDDLNVKNYSSTRGSSGVGCINVSSSGDRDYYMQNPYLDSSQAGLPASQYLDSTKPASLKYETAGKLHSHSYSQARGRVDDMPISNLGGGDGSSHVPYVASQYLNTEADIDRYFRVRDDLHQERKDGLHDREDSYFEKKSGGYHFQDRYLGLGKSVESDIYKFKKEDSFLTSRGYLKGDSDYSLSSSQHKDYDDPKSSGITREGFSVYSPSRELHMPSSDVSYRGRGVLSQQISYDGYSEKKQNVLPAEPEGQFDDARSRSRLYVRLPEKRQEDWSYAEFGRSKMDSTRTGLNNVEADYRDQHILRTDVLKDTVDVRSHKEHMEDDELWGRYSSFQVQSTPDKFDLHGSLHCRREDVDILGTARLNLGAKKGYYGYGGSKLEQNDADVDGGQWSHFENSDPLRSRGYDRRLGNSPRKRSPMAGLSLVEPYERRLRDKHVRDDTSYRNDVGIRISADGNGARRIYNQVDADDEIDLVHLSKKPKSSIRDYEEDTWGVSSEFGSDEPSSSEFYPRYSIKPHKSGSRDIKKRLGQIQKLHVSQRLVEKHKPSIKKRLAPAPSKRRATLPWIKNMRSSKMMTDHNDPDGCVQDQDGDHLGDCLPLATPEPPEKSEEFKQLVQNAFFKFLKQINETLAKRKAYTEQRKAGILKCFVCGSNSEEFAGTESLAMHAFTSMAVGLRAQHLGLHKALCALMGWKTTEHPSSEWHCQEMTNAEIQVLKEDLIIWPPVVVVHNSTIDGTSPGERVIISAEKLETKLRDMSFGSIVKVCNGKPANQSVMLVKFNGTLSGLQEAERLHQSYVKSEHGRAEFKQLKFESGSSRGGSQEKSSGRDNYLYGYLAIAVDLDKLDFDMKKRCVLRSKKQILSIVDVPIDTAGETG